MKFIFLILLITGACLLSYYNAFDALILTGGWAWFGLGCIIYFVGDMLEEFGKWVMNKRTPTIKRTPIKIKGKRCELTDEELMKKLNEDFKED